jgi:hypothetical protein
MSTFARYRFPADPARPRAGRSVTVIPAGADALVLLTVEELAVNELREPCHHWVRTLAYPVRGGALGDALPHQSPVVWQAPPTLGDIAAARAVWDEVDVDLKARVRTMQQDLTRRLSEGLKVAGGTVREIEKKRFERRRNELKKAIGDNQLAKLTQEADRLRAAAKQRSLFAAFDLELARRLSDLEAELALRKGHYERVQDHLKAEEERTLKRVLPLRYALRGEARVYPIAVEIRVAGGAA